MRKLFTLIALLTCFLGVKAVEVVDAEVDFSKMADGSEIKFYGWGASESAKARLVIQGGCLHFASETATDPSWDCQFHPIGGVDVEKGVTYTLHYKIKGTIAQNISALGFGQTPYGQLPITTEWVEGTFAYEAQKDGDGGDLLFQCGDYVGEYDIAYLKITHEEKSSKPTEWVNLLINGDAEGEFGEVACLQVKSWNSDPDEAAKINPAEIVTVDGKKVFVCHAKAVTSPLLWAEDGEQWGTEHRAGDPMPDNAWQNQMWITLPRALKAGEQYKVSFKYKASMAVNTNTQNHGAPGAYIDGSQMGDVKFSTDWQSFEKKASATEGMQSIAFNLGAENYKDDIDFYLDDIEVSVVKVEQGYFVTAENVDNGIAYDYENAVELKYDATEDLYKAQIGTVGKKETWVDRIKISSVRGNDRAFKQNTIRVTKAVEQKKWMVFVAGSDAEIKLPAAGVWSISLDAENGEINFVKLEGDEDRKPIEIKANPTELVIEAQEKTANPWDAQFFIVANRELKSGEVTVIEFKYSCDLETAKVTTQNHNEPGGYINVNSIGDLEFTSTEQSFSKEFVIPSDCAGMKTIAFNLSEIAEACKYTIKDVIWRTDDMTESLIDMEGTKNFIVKEGASVTQHEYGKEPVVEDPDQTGISNVTAKKAASTITFNLAGQRVAKSAKGIVVVNGVKVVKK